LFCLAKKRNSISWRGSDVISPWDRRECVSMRSRHSALTPEPRAWTVRLRIRLVSPWLAHQNWYNNRENPTLRERKRENESEVALAYMQIYRGTREVKVQAQNRLTFAIRHTHKQTKAPFPKKQKKKYWHKYCKTSVSHRLKSELAKSKSFLCITDTRRKFVISCINNYCKIVVKC